MRCETTQRKFYSENRNYGIDLLRIISMMMIVLGHLLSWGGIIESAEKTGYTATHYAITLLEIVGTCGVDCFALISGYVGYGRPIRLSRLIELCIQVWFYTIPITIFFSVYQSEMVTVETWMKAVFPFALRTYWYFSAYFVLFFFIPFINKAIENANWKEVRAYIVIAIVVLTVLPTIFHDDFPGIRGGYSAPWLAIMYSFGAAYKKWKKEFTALFHGRGLFFACILFTWIWSILADFITLYFFGESHFGRVFIKYTSPTIVLASIGLLFFFSNYRCKGSLFIIGLCSSATFGVYLLHTEPLILHTFLEKRFSEVANYNCIVAMLFVIGLTLGIWLICTIIDDVRMILFRVLRINKIADIIGNKLDFFIYRG